MKEQQALLVDDPNPGFKWPVAVAQPIAASANEVWELMSMPGNLEPCHPFCRKNPVEIWPGPESRDQVHYLNGLVFERRFCKWMDGAGYDLEIGRCGGETSYVSWRVTSDGEQKSSLRITVYPHVLQHIPLPLRWMPHLLRVRPMLKHYLTSVVKGFEWYLIRGEPVPRNQWGTHSWFSIPQTSAREPT
jgi:hypothetical protein